MTRTGLIARRATKDVLIATPPIQGEMVYALDTGEHGWLNKVNQLVWKDLLEEVRSLPDGGTDGQYPGIDSNGDVNWKDFPTAPVVPYYIDANLVPYSNSEQGGFSTEFSVPEHAFSAKIQITFNFEFGTYVSNSNFGKIELGLTMVKSESGDGSISVFKKTHIHSDLYSPSSIQVDDGSDILIVSLDTNGDWKIQVMIDHPDYQNITSTSMSRVIYDDVVQSFGFYTTVQI